MCWPVQQLGADEVAVVACPIRDGVVTAGDLYIYLKGHCSGYPIELLGRGFSAE